MAVGLGSRIWSFSERIMSSTSVLIDTHVLIWVISQSKNLKEVPWIENFSSLSISPITLLEMKYLWESGRIPIDFPTFLSRLKRDEYFQVDDVSFDELCTKAFDISWTRDPFDRLLVAHSQLREIPLGTCDTAIRKNYSLVL